MRSLLRLLAVAAVVAALFPAGVSSAAAAAVTGTVATLEKVALSPDAVLVVTIVDQQASPDAGALVGMQRIDGATLPATFSVPFDTAAIDETHSYALYASVVDGARTLQSFDPVPVITGGPTEGVDVLVSTVAGDATLTGEITRSDKSALSATAVAYAVLVNESTGTMIARQVIPAPAAGAIPFAIPVDSGTIDPADTYVAKAAIVDETRRWRSEQGVVAVSGGEIASAISVPVVLVGASTPTPTPKPSATAKPTAKPTAAPTATPRPTARPTAAPTATPEPTPRPTPTPTPRPTAAPTDAPTATPTATPAPTASPSPTAAATPSPAPTPTPVPDTGLVRGTLTYAEDHELTGEARSVVVLVEGTTGPSAGTIVASTSITGGSEPVAFELAYPWAAIKADTTYRLYAGIADGDLAWVTPIGVTVRVPQPLIDDVELPLAFRPDLLKAAVSGTLTGVGLDSARDPEAYGTALVIRVSTGETIGFQLISPTGAAPVPFSVPYDPAAIVADEDYVARGSIWDGTTLWNTDVSTPVITKDNARSDVILTVTAVPSPTPAPTPAPTPEPVPIDENGPLTGGLFLLLLLGGVGAAAVVLVLNRRRQQG